VKIAISGKGGTGKTTLAALLAQLFRQAGHRVFAIDADPDTNLAATLGFPQAAGITPIVEMKELIKERMGVDDLNGVITYFKMNPQVDDLPEKYCVEHKGIRLMVMGEVRKGGGGCACPENTFLRELLAHLLWEREDTVIVDLEAGIEHLGRGTAQAVDVLLVVVEPDLRSIETAGKIKRLATDLGLRKVWAVGNKVGSEEEQEFIERQLAGWKIIGFLPYQREIAASAMTEGGLEVEQLAAQKEIKAVLKALESGASAPPRAKAPGSKTLQRRFR